MTPVTVRAGDGPVVLGVPHAGEWLPEDAAARLNARGLARADADWRVDRLYDGLLDGATMVRANFHRYLIDANRSPNDVSLYPGQNTTGLCPETDFDGAPIYADGAEPDAVEIARRVERWHRPYHTALTAAIAAAKARWGVALLYDCHSIRSRVPFLFDGVLPDFNIGDNDGRSCDLRITDAVEAAARAAADADGYSIARNGRFKGGWTTRHYGRPGDGVHAIQMELAQSAYMEERPPWAWREDRAARLRPHLARILAAAKAAAEAAAEAAEAAAARGRA